MFKFGMPSPLINDFLYSLYNENIIRVNRQKNPSMMMISVIELKNEQNTLYITISEEPLTDPDFYEKLGSLLYLIENIIYKKDRDDNKLTGVLSSNNNIRYGTGERIHLLDITSEQISSIQKSKNYSENYRVWGNNKFKIFKIYSSDDSTATSEQLNKYRNLTDDKLIVKVVFNNTYITERHNLGNSVSYRPFLKTDKKYTDLVACNSGSICSESKIFSYLHTMKLYTNEGISKLEGAIAYWIGKTNNFDSECIKKQKPSVELCNYHPNYSYDDTEKTNLTNMIDTLIINNKISDNLLTRRYNINWELMFRAFALPCPGCFLNKDAYENDERIKWDNRSCLEHNRARRRTIDTKLRQAVLMEDSSDFYSQWNMNTVLDY